MEYGRDHSPRYRAWCALPDGPCEHVAELLPRLSRLACRLVCRSWRHAFTHRLQPLSLDTRWWAACAGASPSGAPRPCESPGSSPSAPPSSSTTDEPATALPQPPGPNRPNRHPLGPSWDALLADVGPALRSVTVRVACAHESKARAAPDLEALEGCLGFLASHPRYSQERLQLQLSLRLALPGTVLQPQSWGRLRSLRLVRCSLTVELAEALPRLPALRHLCVAHAGLAALPQLLAAAGGLSHIHVHGYHTLVIVEDNPHQMAAWRAAVALVEGSGRRADGERSAAAAAAADAGAGGAAGGGGGQHGDGGSGGGDGVRRLRCLAVSAHHLYGDSVMDESELEFESEALRWQISYQAGGCTADDVSCTSSTAAGRRSSGVGQAAGGGECGCCTGGGAGGGGGVPGMAAATGGCAHDPHEEPQPPDLYDRAMYGKTRDGLSYRTRDPGTSSSAPRGEGGLYGGSGSGNAALCAAALVAIDCCCCGGCGGGGGSADVGVLRNGGLTAARPRWPTPMAAEPAGPLPAAAAPPAAAAAGFGPAFGAVPAAAAANPVAAGPWPPPPPTPPAPVVTAAAASSCSRYGVLRLLRSGKREVAVHPPGALAAEAAAPHWAALQYAQLALRPSQGVPPPPRPRAPPEGPHTGAAAAGAAADEGLGEGTGAGPVGAAEGLGFPSLAPLNALPVLSGLWLDPDEGEEEEEEAGEGERGGKGEGEGEGADGGRRGEGIEGAGRGGAGRMGGGEGGGGRGAEAARGSPAEAEVERPGGIRWVRAGDVWVPLHLPPSPPPSSSLPSTSSSPSAPLRPHPPLLPPHHAPVQDAGPHAALLSACTRLRSLALGDRRTPFLGVGDDSAAALARLAALTRLHLSAAYTLPLDEPGATVDGCSSANCSNEPNGLDRRQGEGQGWLRLPPRLAPLGGLAVLQRLSLHFGNPAGRPAIVSARALPPSLTSLSLHGVLLLPDGPNRPTNHLNRLANHLVQLRQHGQPNGADAQADTAGRSNGAGDCGSGGGGPLGRLRELSLSSSFVASAERLGLSGRLRLLSLRDSGLGLASPGAEQEPGLPGSRGDGGGGATEGAAAAAGGGGVRGGGGGGSVQLASFLRGLYGLQTLRLAGSTPTAEVRLPTAGCGLQDLHAASALPALLASLPALRMLHLAQPPPLAPSAPLLAPSAPLQPTREPPAIASAAGGSGGLDLDLDLDPANNLPRWRLTSVALPAAAASGSAAAAAAADAAAAAASPPSDWLTTLLRLLTLYRPHLTCLRVAATCPDLAAAKAAVRHASAVLPSTLPDLMSLTLVLDLGLPYLLSQPGPEAAARAWAGWLREREAELQARMRHSCVSLSPHPNAASRAREAARAALPPPAPQGAARPAMPPANPS
ncbi:hypothetical protein HYH03_006122 [Edaphochlamys debaryana]|uniref:F-box domain-containing protein n=1 Tax=Edaphochlamys debaryana TaxID=47281 RepID=A0A835Y661_9CHLO|nr:hypothetical protein HYH03_006122 [Edaphochlamys debaryana]|eukprot:KAG2495884.1 hypothetical protein HYH03_006122 [Edaphochlamys debaryana]